MPRRFGIYLIFFLSGACGLVYQVIWVRQFGNVFGNTVHSAALVTAIFMCGLGLGSFLAGRIADRRYLDDQEWSLKGYGYLEICIGLSGLFIAIVLPGLGALSSLVSSYEADATGWHELSVGSNLFRYSAALVMLLPVTTLMGGTLTLLIRHLVRQDMSVSGLRIGTLYGANTAGAAAGAFAVDFALVPGFGLLATQAFAVLLNLGVGLAALRWAARSPSLRRPVEVESSSSGTRTSLRGVVARSMNPRRLVGLTGAAILLSGFAAMGMEILWFRLLITVLMSLRAVFSLLLTVILLGIWLGAWTGGVVHRRFGHAALLFIVTQAAFAVVTVTLFMWFDPGTFPKTDLIAATIGTTGIARHLVEAWVLVRVILWVVGLPAFLMGFAYPLANAHVQVTEARVGRRAGFLYLANTLGAVAGALVTGFVLLPALGMQSASLILAACALAPIVPLYYSMGVPGLRRRDRLFHRMVTGTALIAAMGALASWSLQPDDHLEIRKLLHLKRGESVVASSEGINESIVISERLDTGERRLNTNGHSMSATTYEAQRYMRAFVHVALLQVDDPKRVLVICFGVGNTLHAASLYPSLERLEAVDLSRRVLEQAGYFRRWNHDVLKDPRVSVYVNDGRQHLRMQPEGTYDLITLEPPPLAHAGVSSLYSFEFYSLAHSRLRIGGYISQWLPADQMSGPVLASMVRAFLDVFPDSVLLSGFANEFILLGRKGLPSVIDPHRIAARLKALPSVRKDLERIDLATPMEIVGTYAGSSVSMERMSRHSSPVTDDYPIMEYSMIAFVDTIIPKEIFDVEGVRNWCPQCFDGDRPAAVVAGLDQYLALLTGLYESPDFRTTLAGGSFSSPGWVVKGDPETMKLTVQSSGYLQRVMGSR